ncbi:hypothetical protein LTR37_016484 [Vermiconidia calcicola]|uniref:Uncharacterized protein n=1 Tax=Vermiconidia calcicola TaxID=1690605 RepID=A0ACC3MNV8_9PEZI|nr:hypothetical protein LTR37_016484 [Vermiconidia calcicola]
MATTGEEDAASIAQIRDELKDWERLFSKANAGRKATREDIKNDATISAKYAEYSRLRRPAPKPTSTPEKPRRPKSARADGEALKERAANRVTATPKKEAKNTKSAHEEELPDVIEEPTPACIRCALGPTPQKDGEILGIFDMLPAATPSRGDATTRIASTPIVGATPSKATALASSEPTVSRTPQSSGKRFYLDAFAGTPLKRKRGEEHYTPNTAKRQYATPSFLRRSFPLAAIDEEQDSLGVPPPFRKKGLVRSLSTIIQGLKRQEEERMNDDWDVMNEIEAEECGETGRPSAPKVLVEDSQVVNLPLGPDQGDQSSDEASDVDPGALDANGKPRKVWKKKGLKRQTKRVIMRPVTHKPKKAKPAEEAEVDGSDSEVVTETQQLDRPGRKTTRKVSGDADEGRDASEDSGAESDDRHDSQQSQHNQSEKVTKKGKKTSKAGHAKKQEDSQPAEASKKPKKVNALAHTNFRKLKIKNKNSKANGKGGRFGRR